MKIICNLVTEEMVEKFGINDNDSMHTSGKAEIFSVLWSKSKEITALYSTKRIYKSE